MAQSGARVERTVPLTLQGMGLPVRQIERPAEIGRTSSRNVRHPLLGDIDDVIPVLRHSASLKLADRGSFQTIGIITDVGLFLKQLADELGC